jgi:hypothetical protein
MMLESWKIRGVVREHVGGVDELNRTRDLAAKVQGTLGGETSLRHGRVG